MMVNRGCLFLCSWNCNGINGKILELREFINEHSPDIIFLQETHLRPGKTLKIPNYVIIRNDFINPNSPMAIRGTAICIKSNLNFIPVSTPALNVVNAIGIKIILPGTPPLNFFSVYNPNGESASDIKADLKTLLNFDVNTFLLGDFNAHHPFWNCTRSNAYGNAIYDILLHSNADIIFPDSPTHFTHLSSSTIDFGLFNGFNFDKNIESVSELSSDHNPILIKLQIRLPPEPPKIIHKINWTQFHHLVNELPPPPPQINSTDEIDLLVECITDEIKSAVDRATTKKPANEFYKLDPHVRILTTNKNRARKIWQRTHRPEDKIIMNRAQQDLKNYLYKKRQASWSDFLESLSQEDTSIWKSARRFKSSFQSLPPSLLQISRPKHVQMKRKLMPLP